MSKGCLGTFNQCLSNRVDTKSCSIWVDNVIVDDRGDVDVDVVLRHTHLRWHLNDLDFDVYVLKSFAQTGG